MVALVLLRLGYDYIVFNTGKTTMLARSPPFRRVTIISRSRACFEPKANPVRADVKDIV